MNGVSTRAVDELVQALGIATGISRSEVSRISDRLDEHVAAFRDRRLDHTSFPFVYLDATLPARARRPSRRVRPS